jgi:saccharopine dehydrogenase-like NADP-dependent oxidoreductase
MKQILLFGAGKSATVLIDFLVTTVQAKKWQLTIADANKAAIEAKTGQADNTYAVELDINNAEKRQDLIAKADVVISLMPPALHFLIAKDCVQLSKNLLTASYVDDNLRSLAADIEAKGLLFIAEMGLDPGIDHMSAMEIIHRIHAAGGTIQSFKSHCGGLVAPESDNNPWHYKISWNPRNIVLAGKAGAVYKVNDQIVSHKYTDLFGYKKEWCIQTPDNTEWSYYPNRDSLSYIDLYGLQSCHSFMRTTLRHPEFMRGWQQVVNLQLTNESNSIAMNGETAWENLNQSIAKENWLDLHQQEQWQWLQAHGQTAVVKTANASNADLLQAVLEKSLALDANDKDMIIMMQEFDYTTAKGEQKALKSFLQVKGSDALRTAMAKTVGLPLGIAAILMLEEKIDAKGLKIPVHAAIYEPVLKALGSHGIVFQEWEA